ncbi:MAG: hypothetical protein H7Y86_13730 [Rhizobacter sp.]|nr:hypothetical protein [Ferruginibacter sp.]
MKKLLLFLTIYASLLSCNDNNKKPVGDDTTQKQEAAPGFFPVTSYLKGQVAEIKSIGINPLKFVTIKNIKDSVWLKPEEFDSAFAEFLRPEIDSITMADFFSESKFFDQTLNTYTFTYEPKKTLPATMQIKRWDVYVDPETNTVKRVYIEKYAAAQKEMQLTWQARKNCRIVFIATDASGNQTIEREEFIKWNFDEE